MACYRPLTAYQVIGSGSIVWTDTKHDATELQLRCGQCIGCRLDRSTTWATRCYHQAQLYQDNAFLTLTIDDEHMPDNKSLDHRHWQLFMKKLRQARSRALRALHGPSAHLLGKVSYYMAGEYGSGTRRPHYHACLFNHNFNDRLYWRKLKSGSKLYTSDELNKLWGMGFTSIGDVTFESAAYIARYIVAKITGPGSGKFYEHVDPATGEIYQLKPEYNRMSLRPAIGKNWLEKFTADVYPEGQVQIRNTKTKAPRYYDHQFKKADPLAYEQLQHERQQLQKQYLADNTPARLKAKERVKLAQANQLLRSL